MRHCKIRDRRVISNVYLNHKLHDSDVIHLSSSERKRHSREDYPGFSFQVACKPYQMLTNQRLL